MELAEYGMIGASKSRIPQAPSRLLAFLPTVHNTRSIYLSMWWVEQHCLAWLNSGWANGFFIARRLPLKKEWWAQKRAHPTRLHG